MAIFHEILSLRQLFYKETVVILFSIVILTYLIKKLFFKQFLVLDLHFNVLKMFFYIYLPLKLVLFKGLIEKVVLFRRSITLIIYC